MDNNLPSMQFFTDARLREFWGYVRELTLTVSPLIMLAAAVVAVGMLLAIIVNAFKQASRNDDDDDDRNDNNDYEVRRY